MRKYALLILSILINFSIVFSQNNLEAIQNLGQWDSLVEYKVFLPGGEMFLNSTGFTYNFADFADVEKTHHSKEEIEKGLESKINHHSLKVNFIGSNYNCKLASELQNETNYNYFIGNNTENWFSEIKSFNKITYKEIYNGISMQLYKTKGNYKYDFFVKAESDPKQIKIKYSGQDNLYLDEGDLHIETSVNTIVEKSPIAFQIINGIKVNVKCNFIINENEEIEFAFSDGYDKRYELVIDPVLIYSTYSGSTGDNFGFTATYDDFGNGYTGGIGVNDIGSGYPTTIGAFQSFYSGGSTDVTISKFNQNGTSLLYATYIGGTESEEPMSIVVNSNNQLVVLGNTNSTNFPTSINAYDSELNDNGLNTGYDLFLTILSNTGGLVASTFIGGSLDEGRNLLTYFYGDISRGEVIVDDDDNIYVSSNTNSSNFPTTSNSFEENFKGGQDGCVFKMNSNVSDLVWSGILGGNELDQVFGIDIDDNGIIYVCGGTQSNNFPITSNTLRENYVGGTSLYSNYAISTNADGFLTSISSDGTAILASTYIGSEETAFDMVYFVEMGNDNSIYLFGISEGNIPITKSIYSDSGSTQFIQKINKTLDTLLLSSTFGDGTYLGAISPTAFLVDRCNRIYISGWGGELAGNSAYKMEGFNVTNNGYQQTTDNNDFYLAVWNDNMSSLAYATFFGGVDVNGEHVDGGTSRFSPEGIVYQSICASCRGGQFTPTTDGAYSTSNLSGNCTNALFKMQFPLSNVDVEFDGQNIDTTVCTQVPVVFNNLSSNANQYIWYFGDGDSTLTTVDSSTTHSYDNPGTYIVLLVGSNDGDCFDKKRDSAYYKIVVFDPPLADAGPDTTLEECADGIELSGCCGPNYSWSPNIDIENGNSANPKVEPENTINYILTVTDENGCEAYDTLNVEVLEFDPLVPNVFTPNEDMINDFFEIDNIFCNHSLVIYNRWGKEVYFSTDYQSDFDGGELSDGVYYFQIYNDEVSKKGWFQILR